MYSLAGILISEGCGVCVCVCTREEREKERDACFSFYFLLGKVKQHLCYFSQWLLLFLTDYFIRPWLPCVLPTSALPSVPLPNGVQRCVCHQTICYFQSFQQKTIGLDLRIITPHPASFVCSSWGIFSQSLHIPVWLSMPLPCLPHKSWFGVTDFPNFIQDEIHASLSHLPIFYWVILSGNWWERSYDSGLIWWLRILQTIVIQEKGIAA